MTPYAAWRDSVQDLALDVAPLAVLDTETTGLTRFGPERDRIIELCIVHATVSSSDHEIVLRQYIWPDDRTIDPAAQAKHGISLSVLRDLFGKGIIGRFADIQPDVVRLVRGRVQVAHRLSFDAEMLYGEMSGGVAPWGGWAPRGLCTSQLGWAAFPHLASHSLDALCDAVGWTNDNPHAALHDTVAALAVLRGCVAELRSQGHALATVGEALDAMVHGGELRRRLRGAP